MRLFRRRSKRPVERSATAQMRTALHLVLAGDLPAAEAALADAARLDSSSPDVYLALANLYRARGEVGRAIHIHQNLLLQHGLSEPLRREALLGLALDFRSGGFLKRATASFRELLGVEPGNSLALHQLERLDVESGDWEAAIAIRKQIGSADPRSEAILAHLWTGLGRERAKRGQEAEARKAFKRALGHDRRCAEALIELGEQRLREGKRSRAIGFWKRALDLRPGVGLLLYPRLWEAYRSSNDLASFEKLLRARGDGDIEDLDAAIWRARCLEELKRTDEAVALLRDEMQNQPEGFAGAAELGRVLLRAQRGAEALKVFAELLERLPRERRKLHCRSCGTQDLRLHWRCPQCGEWDSFV